MNDPTKFHQNTGQAAQAADAIEKGVQGVGLDNTSGHLGELKKLMDDLANEWHSRASLDHQDRMTRWNAGVVRLAELTKNVAIDLRTGTQSLDRTTGSLGGSTNPYVQGISGE